MDLEEIDARCHDEWVRAYPFNDYRLPRTSLVRGDKGRPCCRARSETTGSSVAVDFYCASCDLRHNES